MTAADWTQLTLYLVVLIGLGYPLGLYMARVYEGRAHFAQKIFGPVERFIYFVLRTDPKQEMNWKSYAVAMLMFNMLGLLAVYALQRLQGFLPLNPAGQAAVSPDSSFNTAVSFATNTNWQGYGGESTMSYLTQMLALTVQNFVSAACGMAVLVALIRGLTRRQTENIGNFWTDLTRTTLYILLPLSLVLSLVLIAEGVPQTFLAYQNVPLVQETTYDNPLKDADGNPIKDEKGNAKTETLPLKEQTIALGPVASQIAIKQLGTNGGGFFNVNSAHPFENPSGLANFLETIAILLIGAGLCFTFGEMVKDRRQGWALLAAMSVIFVGALAVCVWAEFHANPTIRELGVAGYNMEGKETRLGIANSALWATATTAASNGSVNSMHDSFTPLGGMIPMLMIQIGEVIYGGVGSGLYGMLAYVIVAVFIAGLMVGRTPEYLGKKIESYEMKMASIVLLIPAVLLLTGTAIGAVTEAGTSSTSNPGAHGFSQILYAFTSCSNNNGSAFAGLNANTFFYNLLLGICMFIGRYWLAVPILAIAGSLAKKKIIPFGAGTLNTHTPLFVGFLVAVILIFAALLHFPALALGPIVEHLQMFAH
ncbi:MAG TPA: potassium-transporting ATPase subunit KdpA [Planctomycetota bacterium]|jgi:K+-transporting ATPase ATPase A chain